ncbi:hypothetical protein FHW58_002458 [Duganella sp. 1224]|uniref:hypothetical protein n=1 Tax=Duganella sp. 1224 TaxID=2587052 RepID=UPI0015CB120D|nr:hypothetical protein [Duganella sp. 1224]NYE61251.1 hypothetical protein [Duganella sp. 1224]
MNSSEAWFIGQRADSLATMYLTRIPSLRIERLSSDMGIDYLVQVDKHPTQFFGIIIKASRTMRGLIKDSSLSQKMVDELLKQTKNAVFPVALLAVDIKTEEMKFGWINFNSQSKSLKSLSTVDMQPASKETLQKALRDVRDWYAELRKQELSNL